MRINLELKLGGKYCFLKKIEFTRTYCLLFCLRFLDDRVAAALVVKLTYGWHVADEGEDKLVSLSHRVNTDITAAIRPGAFLADYIPQSKLD
jgi:hypothetical protein